MSQSWLRRTAIIVSAFYLNSCTLAVINKAKGIEKSRISATATVESIWSDNANNEFIICMIDFSKLPNNQGNHYMLKIPKDLIQKELTDRIRFEKRNVQEEKPKNKQHWWSWSFYRDRSDVKLYDLSVVTDYSCNKPKPDWHKIEVVKAPNQLSITEASRYRGDVIKQKISKRLPFLLFTQSPGLLYTPDSLCKASGQNSCLLLVSNPQIQDQKDSLRTYDEIFNVDELVWKSKPKPGWYAAVPLAIIVDAVIVSAIIIIVGSAGPRP